MRITFENINNKSNKIEYSVGRMYYMHNLCKGYLIWELIGFDLSDNLAFLKHPETNKKITVQLTWLKTTNRTSNLPYYVSRKKRM